MTRPQSLTIMNRSVPSGTHICAFFSGPAGRDDVVMPFLADGIRAGQKCICVLESLGPADVLARLDRQVDLGRSVETGQLELATPGDAYLRSGTFCTDDMLSYWQQAAAAAQSAKGSGLLRATGEMPSVLEPSRRPHGVLPVRSQAHRLRRQPPGGDLLPLRPAAFRRRGADGHPADAPHGGRGRRGARQPVLRRPGRVPPRHGVGSGRPPGPGRPRPRTALRAAEHACARDAADPAGQPGQHPALRRERGRVAGVLHDRGHLPGRPVAGRPAPAPAGRQPPGARTLPAEGGPVPLAGVPWSWAYSLSSRHGPAGYLVVGAQAPPAEE